MKRRDLLKLTMAGGLLGHWRIGHAGVTVSPGLSEVLASTLEGDQIVIPKPRVQELQASISGTLLQNGHPAYDTTRRVWNGMVDKYPAIIVQCLDPGDVVAAINFAREQRLLTSVRCGGHNFAGKAVAEGGLMIDLSLMNTVEIDRSRKTAWVAGGSRLGALDRASLGQNLTTTLGNDSDTGVGGLTLGGGLGRLNRMHGLTIDNLLGADIVTADGIMRRASASENPDLFWAIRGGGGNFGVATRFKFQLHDIDPIIYGGHIVFPWQKAAELLRLYAQYERDLPRQMYMVPLMYNDPKHGRLIALEVCYNGSSAEAEKLLQPIKEFGKPLENQLAPMPYLRMQTTTNPASGRCQYIKSGFIAKLDDDVIDAMVEHFPEEPGRRAFFQQMGGAVADVAPEATAFQHRSARFNVNLTDSWQNPADINQHRMSVRRQWRKLMPSTQGFYTNLMEHGPRNTRANYGVNLHRLVGIKTEYDPDNQFRLNANIPPAV
jgi:FAD/FMN-containing dehydrogenase